MKNPDIFLFFDGHEEQLALYEALEAAIWKELGEVEIRVQKSQISFYQRHMFACVSMMPVKKALRRGDTCLVVSLGLGRKIESPRAAACAQPYPGRWTNHVPIYNKDEIDEELLEWLREACAFSSAKR